MEVIGKAAEESMVTAVEDLKRLDTYKMNKGEIRMKYDIIAKNFFTFHSG